MFSVQPKGRYQLTPSGHFTNLKKNKKMPIWQKVENRDTVPYLSPTLPAVPTAPPYIRPRPYGTPGGRGSNNMLTYGGSNMENPTPGRRDIILYYPVESYQTK